MQLSEAKILIVDDEPALREIFAKWLMKLGCGTVATAVDGEDALDKLHAGEFDVLISDVRMPRMDGITLVRRLAEVQRSIPSIIFVSGFGDVDQREMNSHGVEAFLAKPLRMEELIEAIRKALADRNSLWLSPMEIAPRQTMRLSTDPGVKVEGDSQIRVGRGGFSLHYPHPLSLGKVSFACDGQDEEEQLCGQGLVHWRSRIDQRVGIEFVYLEESSRNRVLEKIGRDRPRSFIPG